MQSLARHKKDTRLSPSLQVSIISGLFFILSVDRGSIPQLLRLLQKEHSFSASHLGLLGGANYIGRAIGSPACTVVSILRPRSEIKIIAACVMLWTLGMMITGLLFSLVSCPLFAHICNDMHIAEISHCNTREWVTLCYSSSHASSPGQVCLGSFSVVPLSGGRTDIYGGRCRRDCHAYTWVAPPLPLPLLSNAIVLRCSALTSCCHQACHRCGLCAGSEVSHLPQNENKETPPSWIKLYGICIFLDWISQFSAFAHLHSFTQVCISSQRHRY